MAADRPTLSLSMSDFIAPDAPLTSPVSDDYAYSPTAMDSFSFEFPPYSYADDSAASSPGSPMLAERALKMRMTPDYSSDASMPTSQVFDLEPTPVSSREASAAASPEPNTEVKKERAPSKRPSESNIKPDAPSKKQRTERVTTKDFVPPDVSGLSKREARLVKNRAAAFLSRQRKREEFECMEVRVAELEQENARLQAIAAGVAPPPVQVVQQPAAVELFSEIDQLKARLAEAEKREQELNDKLAARPAPAVKQEEPAESRLSPLRPAVPASSPRLGASLSLLVLLCALPSIFAVSGGAPGADMLSTSGFPFAAQAGHGLDVGAGLNLFGNDVDWDNSPMDLDLERPLTMPSRLEFADNLGALGLGGLDISFDAEAAADGKIRVRIHHPASSAPSSPVMPASPFEIDAPAWGSGWSTPPAEDPFLGVGAPLDLEDGMFGFDLPRSRSVSPSIDTPYGRRRVRIALKSAPAGTDGGEWEIELC
ncbi:unnamed protein product [Peniophora sp. CBMAI 1063]|nr:unnamed protein product [Peniophora sp. CBMAI 1063]